jgi:hypothetical protein
MPDTDNQPDFTGITTQHGEICQFKTPPTLTAEAKITLTRHNCRIEEHPEGYLIHFPKGTTYARICRYGVTEHRRITLPDGYQLHDFYDWHRDTSILYYTRE